MLLKALNTREASRVGTALADGFSFPTKSMPGGGATQPQAAAAASRELEKSLQGFLKRVDHETRALRLNIINRAMIANSFKWRLLEKGVEREMAGELTQALVVRLSSKEAGNGNTAHAIRATEPPARRSRNNIERLLAQADQCAAQGAWAEVIVHCEQLLALEPRHAIARHNLGAAHCQLGQYREAEQQFRQAIKLRPTYVEPHTHLGTVLRWRGQIAESEIPLRQALQLSPTDPNAQLSLGVTLQLLGRLGDAQLLFEKVLRLAPRQVEALASLGQIAALQGRMADAEATLKRALELDAHSPAVLAALIRLRRMAPSDHALIMAAEASVAAGLAPYDEGMVRYATGKYYDDVGEYTKAFRSFQRANDLHRPRAEPYDRHAHRQSVDDLIRVYTSEVLSRPQAGASDSGRPVIVVGMLRSGTSLVEQIIASHPAARGAGELAFWTEAVKRRGSTLREQPPGETQRRKLAGAYLRELSRHSADALRVVDKATFNSDYLGIIHTVFPNVRMIYLRRDPIDSCLSSYFQPFPAALNFTMDLSDLAHYYGEHRRLIAHWRSALPPGTLLDVPYEGLVEDPQGWSRRIIDFIGLEWNASCLDFHRTERKVMTASYSQVRQKIYRHAAGRWRNYEKFIAPLLELRDEGA